MRDEPPFLRDIALKSLRSPIKFLESGLHHGIRERFAKGRDPIRCEPPVIVVAGTIFPVVDFRVCHTAAGEKPDGIDDGLVKRTMNVDKNSIYVEDHELGGEFHRISSIA